MKLEIIKKMLIFWQAFFGSKLENCSLPLRETIKKIPGEGVRGGVPPLKGGNLFKRTLNHLTPRGLVGLIGMVRSTNLSMNFPRNVELIC